MIFSITKTVLAGIIRVKEVTDLNFAGDPLILFARRISSKIMEQIMPVILLTVVIVLIIFTTAKWKIHPLPVLLLGAALFGIAGNFGVVNTINMISGGFGNTMKSIGIVIISGTMIGVFMEQRGALKVIARKIINLTGEKRTPLAMAIIGYVVSICIFCDSAFIILIGLWKKIGKMTKIPLAIGATALSMGLFASHCFIPPTPGPLAAMSFLGADFGKVLLFGSLAALAAVTAGYIYASFAGKNETLAGENETIREDNSAETVFQHHWSIAFLPIVVPLILIGTGSVANVLKNSLPQKLTEFLIAAGNPVIALGIGAVVAVFCIGKCKRSELTADGLMGKAVIDAANILIITAAGGAFGEVLKQVDFRPLLPGNAENMGVFALLLPLSFASMLKIAQGSSTLAILTAANVTLPLLEVLGLATPVMRALTCCAVCCGSMIVSHTNDSFFWVVVKFSGMSVRQGLKLQTIGTLVSGIAAAITLLIIAAICI